MSRAPLRPPVYFQTGGVDASVGHELALCAWTRQLDGATVEDCAMQLTEDMIAVVLNSPTEEAAGTLYGALLNLLEMAGKPSITAGTHGRVETLQDLQ